MKYFLLGSSSKQGTLFFRVVKRKPELNIRVSTGIKVGVAAWNKSQTSTSAWDRFIHTESGKAIVEKLRLIDEAVNNLLANGRINSNADKTIIEAFVNVIVNGDAIRIEEEQKELQRKKDEEQKGNIISFFNDFLEGIESGVVKHGNGENYRKSTLVNWKSFAKHLNGYCKKSTTFDDIDKAFADKFCAFLERKGMMPHTVNKYVICFRKLCNIAAEYGANKNATSLRVWKERKVDDDSMRAEIYLTEDELDALYKYPLDKREEEVRDVFLLGCLSCQRYSDYGSFTKKNFGQTANGTCVIKVKQAKTGSYIEIPIMDERVFEICNKYNYEFPRITPRRINDYLQNIMKRLAEVCPSLNEKFPTMLTQQEKQKEIHFVELSKRVSQGARLNAEDGRTYRNMLAYAQEHDGQPLFERDVNGNVVKFKWELVTSHTARRSGVTNLYKSGFLNTREMMAISGHQTEKVFEHYIKMGASEMADRIAEKMAMENKTNKKEQGKIV